MCACRHGERLRARTGACSTREPQAPKETLTGCVVEAKTTNGGKAYVLNNVEGGSAKMYILEGSSQSEFATNVNKKLEVTGPVQQPNAPPAEAGAAANPKCCVRPRAGRIHEGSC